MTQETVTNGTEALFTREGMPPVKEMIPCALQHVLASFAGIITPAVIMAGVYGFNSQQSTDIIQVALILSAIDTALQAFAPFRRIGGGLPIVMGVSFAFLPALQAMGASGFSFGALLGGEIVGGAVAVLFGLAYSKIKWLFPPVVTGTVIFSIGVSLYPTAVKYMAGGMGTSLWGTPQAWCVALITFAVVFALANFGKGTLKLGSVFFGMIVGMIVSIPFGMIDFSSVATAQVFALPKLMPYALEFDPEVCITLAVVFPMVAIQVIGDVSAACLGSPIYFYHLPAQAKALVDRSQRIWAGVEAGRPAGKGPLVLAALAAARPRGEQLFTGSLLGLKYFFASFGARIADTRTLRGLACPEDLLSRPDLCADLERWGRDWAVRLAEGRP